MNGGAGGRGPYRRGATRMNMGGDDVFSMFTGGPGVSFSFSSSGPGGTTFRSFGQDGRRTRHENLQNGQRSHNTGRAGPQVLDLGEALQDMCWKMFKNCFFFVFMLQMFLGYIPSAFFGFVSNLFTSETDIYKYDFSLIGTPVYSN